MQEIGDIIKRENVTALLHGGDLFDRPDAQIAVAGKFASIFMNYGIPIYIISGNHDSFGQNPNTIDRSMLGLFSSIGVVHLLDNKSVLLKEETNRQELQRCQKSSLKNCLDIYRLFLFLEEKRTP